MNGLLLWAASFILPGYKVNGLIAGILGSLVISIVNWLFAIVLGGDKSE
jgi:putative membrane protein